MGRRARVAILCGAAAALATAAFFYLRDTSGTPPSGPASFNVDRVLVEKAKRRLTLYDGATAVRSYPISLGGNPLGHKRQEGDRRTPEGLYALDWRNPNSKFHLSLHVSYPDAADRVSAARRGVKPGGDIMVHGLPNGLGAFAGQMLKRDWTDGCIAVNNEAIEEIWLNVKDGTPIEIRP